MKNNDIKFVFFGTPRRAAFILEELKKQSMFPSLIVTMPDKPQGRKHIITSSPTKHWADENNILTLQPEKLNNSFRKALEKTSWDVFVVVSYGKVLPEWLFNMARHGTLNVHFSALPLYRGAAPVVQQVLDGIETTATTIILMDKEIDHGPIIAQEFFPVPKPLPTSGELVEIFAQKTGPLLAESIINWTSGKIKSKEQNHASATFTKRVSKIDAEINLSDNDEVNFRKIQAYTPRPGPYFFTEHRGKRIRVKITKIIFENNSLFIQRVIPEGKKEMDYKTFLSTQ